MHYDIIFTFILSSLALTVSPGPDILFVISQSFSKGKKQAIMTSLGLTTGIFFHTFLVIVGFALLIKENQKLFFILKFIGAIYFIYLAVTTFLNRKKKYKNQLLYKKKSSDFKRGLLMNLLNPKVSLFFIVLFPSFLFHDYLNNQIQFAILGILFWIQATFVFVTVSLFATRIKLLIDNDGLFAKNSFWLEIFIYLFITIWIFM
ncbi:MAG: LysE family translocator [Bacteroidetes bacterium]|jgi:threonine/homoserine/homoserine lactone efflux protein|nr:LysE family translocator [Bacteroidota bacterium]MDA1018583.1 LysE family translocator [Bacteroidota bacterium]|tara:strand:- start:114528 stop:115139 length:612 start_codon:yes stop_codon:yes gene_type:complete